MKGSVQSPLSTIGPYIVGAALLLPPTASTIPTVNLLNDGAAKAYVFVDVQQKPTTSRDVFSTYSWDLAQPELAPLTLVHVQLEDLLETYEPFVASEGWRAEAVLEGPFVVEDEDRPSAFLDEYDLSAINLYEEN